MDKSERVLNYMQNMLVFSLQVVTVFLIITQSLLLIPGMGARFNIALHLEGEPLLEQKNLYQAGSITPTPWTSLTLQLLESNSRPDVAIEINGNNIGNFLQKEFNLAVQHGDFITIFNSADNPPVKVIIMKKTNNILTPKLETMVEGNGRMYFDAVVLK